MSEQHTNLRVSRVLEGLRRDVEPAGIALDARVFDLAEKAWVGKAGSVAPSGFGDDGYVLTLPGLSHLLPSAPDGGADLVAVVDTVADWVTDEIGHGWPELYDASGTFIGLLTPTADGEGVSWVTGRHRIQVGELAAAAVALPPRWDGSRP